MASDISYDWKAHPVGVDWMISFKVSDEIAQYIPEVYHDQMGYN